MKKLWLLTILVLLQFSFSIFKAQAQTNIDRTIFFEAQGITLKDAFLQVEKLSGLSINYSNTQLNDQRIVRINKANRSVKETLNVLLNGTSFTFKQSSASNILIIPKPQTNGKLTGKVVDESGAALPGAVIRIVGGVVGQTEDDGKYALNVAPGIYSVEISFISYEKFIAQSVAIKANSLTTLNATLKPSSNDLSEVVVTALGIKREEKSLGYAVTKIDSNQLTDAVSSNWSDALSGKVAGLNLVRSNGGPAGSNKIILRGENNLTGDNEALIVLDGVVINNSGGRRTANASDAVYGTGSDNMPADYGSSVNDINPEDIESVTVLKGPGAAALYGQRGANGAIIITTKSGNSKKKD
ncbi:TonB-dependent receptor plug domain-containing protein [Pedobacter panaciterrae]